MKKIIIGIVAVVVIALIWWMVGRGPSAEQAATTEASQFSAELDGLNQSDLNAEFQDLDADMNQL